MIRIGPKDRVVLKIERNGFIIPDEYPFYSRAALIKAIWPEGIEGLRGMVESWGYRAVQAETLDNARSALAMLEE